MEALYISVAVTCFGGAADVDERRPALCQVWLPHFSDLQCAANHDSLMPLAGDRRGAAIVLREDFMSQDLRHLARRSRG